MTLLFIESFEDTSTLSHKYDTVSLSSSMEYGATGEVRTGSRCLRIANDSTPQTLGNIFDTSHGTFIIGMAFRGNDGSGAEESRFFQFGNDDSSAQCDIQWHSINRSLRVTADGIAYRSANDIVFQDTWHYIEVKVVASSGAAGSIVARVDGTEVINQTGIKTIGAGSTDSFNRFFFRNQTGNNGRIDDFYIADAAGTQNNDFLGDTEVHLLRPNGNGTTNQFVGQDADSTDNYLNVDDSPSSDEDSTYNESSTTGNIDLYNLDNISSLASGVVAGVQLMQRVRKTDTGARSYRRVLRSGGTNYTGSDIALAEDYVSHFELLEQDPDTGAAWTLTGVDNAELGVEVRS